MSRTVAPKRAARARESSIIVKAALRKRDTHGRLRSQIPHNDADPTVVARLEATIVRVVTSPQAKFDRRRYDGLMRAWEQLQSAETDSSSP